MREQELLVLRRVAEASLDPDEKAIQGTWEVVSASAKISDMSRASGTQPRFRHYSAPYGEIAAGRKVVIDRFNLTIKGLPTEKAGSDAAGAVTPGAGGVAESLTAPPSPLLPPPGSGPCRNGSPGRRRVSDSAVSAEPQVP